MAVDQLVDPEAGHRLPRKQRAVDGAALHCLISLVCRQRNDVDAERFGSRQARTGGADLQRLDVIERLDRLDRMNLERPADEDVEQRRVGEFLGREPVLGIPLPDHRAADRRVLAQQRQLGRLQ